MTTTIVCDTCRQPYKPTRKTNSLIERPGTTLRGHCPACTAKHEAAWYARKNAAAAAAAAAAV